MNKFNILIFIFKILIALIAGWFERKLFLRYYWYEFYQMGTKLDLNNLDGKLADFYLAFISGFYTIDAPLTIESNLKELYSAAFSEDELTVRRTRIIKRMVYLIGNLILVGVLTITSVLFLSGKEINIMLYHKTDDDPIPENSVEEILIQNYIQLIGIYWNFKLVKSTLKTMIWCLNKVINIYKQKTE